MQTVVQRKRAAHRKKQRLPLRLYLRESGPALAGKFGEAFLFFFLSLSECFRLPSPFAVCALCAWLYTRRGLLFPAAGLLLSLGLRLLWGVAIDPMQYAGCALLMMYYTTVSGWMLAYFFKFVSGAFTTVTVETSDSVFANMLGNPVEMGIFMAVMEFFMSALSVAVVAVGGALIMAGRRGLKRSRRS